MDTNMNKTDLNLTKLTVSAKRSAIKMQWKQVVSTVSRQRRELVWSKLGCLADKRVRELSRKETFPGREGS